MNASKVPVLPDWTRHSWASVAERQWWAPLFVDASRAFLMWERYSVVKGLRKACWQDVKPEDLIATNEWVARHGLVVVPTTSMPAYTGYSAQEKSVKPGEPFVYRIVITRPQFVKDIYDTRYSFDERMGRLLDYPICCQRAFKRTWGKGQVDNTWEQFNNSDSIGSASTLMRWMGIRLIPHMPCRYDCIASVRRAESYVTLGQQGGNSAQVSLIKEVLNWPVEYSRLFGIAEIVTPGLKISTRTDWTPNKQAFSKQGTYNKPEPWLWTDNGFSDPSAMREAHNVILRSLIEKLPLKARVMDLGCGNGLLLRNLTRERPDVIIGGIDSNVNSVAHCPMLLGKWIHGTIESGAWANWNPTAVLINPIRLLEMNYADAEMTRMRLRHPNIREIFVYAYPDATKTESLEELTALRAQLPKMQPLQRTPAVSVGLVVQS